MALALVRGWESGCTAVTALVQGDRLTVGHVGDSRIVLCRQGRAVALTKDHSPNDADELERIEKEGATVKNGMVAFLIALIPTFVLSHACLVGCCGFCCGVISTATRPWHPRTLKLAKYYLLCVLVLHSLCCCSPLT